ncbi:MAG: LysM peptidoglycan-binding domain-containing protein [Cetobacterium sp.]
MTDNIETVADDTVAAMPVDTTPEAPKKAAKEKPASEGAKRQHVVLMNDTLFNLARDYQVEGGWEALYEANKEVIGLEPNRIFAGQILTLP